MALYGVVFYLPYIPKPLVSYTRLIGMREKSMKERERKKFYKAGAIQIHNRIEYRKKQKGIVD